MMRVPKNLQAAFEDTRLRLVDERSTDTLAAAELALDTAARVEKQIIRLWDMVKETNFPEFQQEAKRLADCFELNQKLVKELHNRLDKQGKALDEMIVNMDKMRTWAKERSNKETSK